MKILFVAHNFPRHDKDVAGSFLLSLARGLIKRGHSVMAVVPHDAGLHERDELHGVHIRRYRYAADDAERLAYTGTMAEQVMKSWGSRLQLLQLLRACRRETRRAVTEWNPDIVHIHWWFPNAMAVHTARFGGVPRVITSHGTDLFLLDRVSAARPIAKRVLSRAARVTVISTPLVQRVTDLGVPLERIDVIPMPIDRDILESPAVESPPASRALRLLFAGRLIERKGAEYAIRAVKLLNSRGIECNLTIVGDGHLRVDLDNLCDELDLGTLVHFSGMVPPAEVIDAMRNSDVFLMPAVTDWKGEREGFGMVIVEAMMSGLPVVATESGGIPDIIQDGVNGFLVGERDSESIAAAVAKLARNKDLAQRIRVAARERVLDRFHPDAIAARFEDVYLSAANTQR